MSLQFIMGPSGAGKSHYLYQNITEESLLHPEKNYIVIVPEQFTMQTQRDLVLASPRKGIMNVDVLSFNRLAYRIFEEVGGNSQIVLDDVGKSFVLRKIAGDYEKELKILGSNLKKPGFISEMQSIISEFTQYDVQASTLDELTKDIEENQFYYKIKDIQTIYQGFQEYLRGKYITGEELLELLCDAVPKSNILKNSVIVLDGFTGFTPIQNKLLYELLRVCEKIMVAVTIGTQKKKLPLFEMSDKMMASLADIAHRAKTEIENPVEMFSRPSYRFCENEPLAFMEEHLFQYSREQFVKEQDAVQIWNARNPKEEIDFVVQQIRRLVRTQGIRYRDIAVITSDMNVYANSAEKAFANYEIPVFMDHKRSILLNSFVEYLRSLLAMAEQNFTYESVFRFLRTDLLNFTREEIDMLENYCVALGIHGYKKWQTKWIRRMSGMDDHQLGLVNELRERFVAQIEEVMTELKSRSKTVTSVTKALHAYLYKNELQKSVREYEKRFAEAGELALEKEYAQIYRIVMEIFDKFVELLGEEKISLKEYCKLLDAGLETAKVGIIPPSLDQVVVGDIERTRIKDVKVVFFVGINDAYIPGKAKAGGLLSELDREKFAVKGIELSPTAKERIFIQKFYLYWIMTKPSKQLILSYSSVSSSGNTLRPAYLISDMTKMFPKLRIQKVTQDIQARELTAEIGMQVLAEQLQNRGNELGKEWQELYTWYKKCPEWEERLRKIVDAAFGQRENASLTRETAEKLYGEILRNSVSRLEKYSACAYAHFLSYGIRLKEREVYQFQALDMGNLFHIAMEKYALKISRSKYRWTTVPETVQQQMITECVEECIVDYDNTILYSSARNEYMIQRLDRMMRRSVWALTQQLGKGEFEPSGFEVAYDSGAIALEDDHMMRLHGKIDRIDVCEEEDSVYVKVVDYKTGSKEFKAEELYYGLQMQLVVYLNAAMEKEADNHPEKMIVPAGFFYYQMNDPVIDKSLDEDTRKQKLLRKLCPSGIVNADEEVVKRLDRTLEGKSDVIPVSRNKNGSLAKNSSVLSGEDMAVLSRYAKGKVEQVGKEIMDGHIEVAPYALGEQNACTFCPYGGVCGFDEHLPGYSYRKLKGMSDKDALKKMREEV